MKNKFLVFIFLTLTTFSACKKDQLDVETLKRFVDISHKSTGAFDNPFLLELSPNDVAAILPSGDIMFKGTYKIKGNKIKVKAEIGTFEFKILSPTELQDLTYGKKLILLTD